MSFLRNKNIIIIIIISIPLADLMLENLDKILQYISLHWYSIFQKQSYTRFCKHITL